MEELTHRSGYVALVGCPNVGKSTLLNRLAGSKLAAVTARPQTTRNRITAIKTSPNAQIVLVDTPGIHYARSEINARMVSAAYRAAVDADLVAIVLDARTGVTDGDRAFVRQLTSARQRPAAVLLVLNKLDLVARAELAQGLEVASRVMPEADIIPVSALTGENVEELERVILERLPTGPALYPGDQLTDQTERFLAQEMIREKLMEAMQQELPYAVAVLVEGYREERERNLTIISATVLVERPSQKAIVIGQGGRQIRDAGKSAREELEKILDRRIFLDLHVKVHRNWRRDPQILRELGI